MLTWDKATISVGGNNVGFANIINDCVYRFKGVFSGNCQDTIKTSQNLINTELGPAVKQCLQAFMDRPQHPKLRIFVTGYAQFFNQEKTQCDDVSWNYWQSDPVAGSGDKMTRALRRQLNELVLSVNAKLEEVVRSFQAPGIILFVNYDDNQEMQDDRFCGKFTEPQRPGTDRKELVMHQWYTPDGQLQGDDGGVFMANDTDFTPDWAAGMAQFAQTTPAPVVAEPFEAAPVDISAFPRVPSGWMKVFHPTQKGHRIIRDAVLTAYKFEEALEDLGGALGDILEGVGQGTQQPAPAESPIPNPPVATATPVAARK